jgi:DNA-binding transcriptional ArsR family regulator
VDNPLETLFGRTAARLLLYLFHHGEVYATGAAKDLGIQLSAVQRQLQKLESVGFLSSKLAGRTRLYSIDPKSPTARKLQEFIGVFYEGMPLAERELMFRTRRRPRRGGKPVRGR